MHLKGYISTKSKDCYLYFADCTALSFYLEHRVSEDIDSGLT